MQKENTVTTVERKKIPKYSEKLILRYLG